MNYETVSSEEIIRKTAEAIKQRGVEVFIVNDRKEALDKVKSLIPEGQTVMNGSSTTLDEIGFTEYFKSGNHILFARADFSLLKEKGLKGKFGTAAEPHR